MSSELSAAREQPWKSVSDVRCGTSFMKQKNILALVFLPQILTCVLNFAHAWSWLCSEQRNVVVGLNVV